MWSDTQRPLSVSIEWPESAAKLTSCIHVMHHRTNPADDLAHSPLPRLMNRNDPLPLIRRPANNGPSGSSCLQVDREKLARYGYAILVLSWLLLLVTASFVLKGWKLIIAPWANDPSTLALHKSVFIWCERIDRYVIGFWCVYVVMWWWFLVSWIALKLFRHSKGIHSTPNHTVPSFE